MWQWQKELFLQILTSNTFQKNYLKIRFDKVFYYKGCKPEKDAVNVFL